MKTNVQVLLWEWKERRTEKGGGREKEGGREKGGGREREEERRQMDVTKCSIFSTVQ